MTAWLSQHWHTLRAALARMGRAPLGTVLNVAVIGVALALPAGLYLALDNLRGFTRHLGADPRLTVFMALDASRADAAQIAARLRQHARIREVRFVPREQALDDLKKSAGLADIAETLPQNPLPDAFVIVPKEQIPAVLDGLRDELGAWPKVAHVQLDSIWARRLAAALGLARGVVGLLAVLLGFALVSVTFNTIRLQILTRREEIEVAKLIGATDGFIRRPFLYSGALQGLAGGIAAALIVAAAIELANRGLTELGSLYGLALRLGHLSPADSLTLLALSTALGWAGAWLSVSKHLHQIEPN